MMLNIYSQNEFLFNFELKEDKEYILGRHKNCDIHIDIKNGISRRHLKLVLKDNKLNVELLSELGELLYQGKQQKNIEVSKNDEFTIGYFKFKFIGNLDDVDDQTVTIHQHNVDDKTNFAVKDDLVYKPQEQLNEVTNQNSIEDLQALDDLKASQSPLKDIQETQHNKLTGEDTDLQLSSENEEKINTLALELENQEYSKDVYSENSIENIGKINNSQLELQSKEQTNAELSEGLSKNTEKTDIPQLESSNQENINDEQTETATQKFSVFLHILSSTNEVKNSFELNGNNWTLGRGKENSINLPHNFLSRTHLELVLTNDGLYICDFNSGNGTNINGKRIPSNTHIKVFFDDIIEIKTLKIKVELVNKHFESIVKDIKLESDDKNKISEKLQKPESSITIEKSDQIKNTKVSDKPESLKKTEKSEVFTLPKNYVSPQEKRKKKKTLLMRGLIILIIAGGVCFKLMNKDNSVERKVSSQDSSKPMNKKLRKINNPVVMSNIYNQANNYYNQEKYLSCLTEIEKLHKIAPEYKTSKKLLSLCQNGLAYQKEINRKNEREKQTQKIENKTKMISDQCKSKFDQFKNKQELNICLDQLLVLNPDHPTIFELNNKWDKKDFANTRKKELNVIKNKNKSSAESNYKKAKEYHKQGNVRSAMYYYNQYINSPYATKSKKKSSSRSVASINKHLNNLMKQAIAACKKSHKSKNLKATVIDCDKVLNKYPSNSQAKRYRKNAINKLRAKAKELYTDANLAESLGNISAAKDKWKQILNTHIPTDEYYKKAERKLGKYN